MGICRFFRDKSRIGDNIDSYVVDDDHLIIEWEIPSRFIGRKLGDAKFEEEFGLKLIALKRYDAKIDKSLVMNNPSDETVFVEKDVFVLFGHPKNFRKLGIQVS